jgi:hypothetical protein
MKLDLQLLMNVNYAVQANSALQRVFWNQLVPAMPATFARKEALLAPHRVFLIAHHQPLGVFVQQAIFVRQGVHGQILAWGAHTCQSWAALGHAHYALLATLANRTQVNQHTCAAWGIFAQKGLLWVPRSLARPEHTMQGSAQAASQAV